MRKSVIPAVLAATSLLPAELPVKRVVLYKHGVGYFERAGDLAAGETARLAFKASEMNDVLKSLTVDDSAGGAGSKVTGIRYDSSMPLEQRLGDYPFVIGEQVPLSQFLDQLKGARVEIESAGQKLAGTILSGRSTGPTDTLPQREQLVLLTESNDLRTIDLAAVTTLRLSDPALQQQLRDYLSAMAGSRSREQRSVYIDSTGTGARKLSASYLIPTAIWKSSYRLILGSTAQPLLEGWAIVDNTTNDDWTNIRLSLVSGKPVSFQSRLYDPKFIDRPFADLPEEMAAAPILYQGAMAGLAGAPPAPPPPPAKAAPMSKAGPMRPNVQMDAAEVSAQRFSTPSNIAVQTESRDLGELFEYGFSQPVTVRKNQSAMLPFLQQPIDARRLLIYSDRSSQNPRTAAEISNNTGKTLDGGPITVFDNSAYAGEALVETVKSGDKRLISYGVDLGTRITTNIDSGSRDYREFHANRGIITAKAGSEETTTFTIRNVDARPKTLIVEHPLRPNYRLINQKPAETTANANRFSVALKPSATETFVLKEDRLDDEYIALASATPDFILNILRNRALPASARPALEKIVAQKRAIAEADAAIRLAQQRITELSKDQDRLRENLRSLNSISGQGEVVQRYAADLASREQQIVTLRDQSAQQQQKKAALESELNAMLEQLQF